METYKFYIDAGHGGADSGAVGNGLMEKNLTLKIAKKIKTMLLQYSNVDVRLSREGDQTLSLKQRTDDANAWGADFLYSIHINAGGGEGYEDFIHDDLSATSKTAKLRDKIHVEIGKQVDFKNRGKKRANFHMLRESDMSAVLTESGFIDNKGDATKLKNDAYLNKIARGHVNGLVQAFKLKAKAEQNHHVAKMGETLYEIAQKYRTNVDTIMKLNPNIHDENFIFVGQVIKLPN